MPLELLDPTPGGDKWSTEGYPKLNAAIEEINRLNDVLDGNTAFYPFLPVTGTNLFFPTAVATTLISSGKVIYGTFALGGATITDDGFGWEVHIPSEFSVCSSNPIMSAHVVLRNVSDNTVESYVSGYGFTTIDAICMGGTYRIRIMFDDNYSPAPGSITFGATVNFTLKIA